MSEGSMRRRRRHPSSPELALAAPLPDNDDLLREILLRLPPLPSSFPRASLVNKRWRRILSDPQFIRRFREFHHRRAPLLGCFISKFGQAYFAPTLDPPNRIPSARLNLPLSRDEGCRFLGCRHGLVLSLNFRRLEIAVWDPVTGDKRCVALPRGINSVVAEYIVCGALVCDDHAGRVPLESFKVVLLWTDNVLQDADPHAFVLLYESKADSWSNIISTSIRAHLIKKASILVGNSLYWLLFTYENGNGGILQFDLDMNNLTVIDTPRNAQLNSQSQILRMEDSRLGLAVKSGFSIQLWEMKPNSEGGAKWMLHKTINVDKLLSLGRVLGDMSFIVIHGYDEDSNAILVSSSDDLQVFMVQLKSLQFKSLFKINNITGTCHPFKSFFTTGMGIASGDIGAQILNNT